MVGARQVHEVRLIGGLWKRSRLPVVDRPGLRPTPDRVRETLFNWLGQDLTGWRCIDAFAGAGALGFEAASRGAAQVWMIDRDGALVSGLKRVKERLDAQTVQIECGDGVVALQRAKPQSWDLIFLDPPYDSDLLRPALAAAQRALAPGGLVYLESARPWSPTSQADGRGGAGADWEQFRHMKAGQVHAHLLRAATLTPANESERSPAPL